MRILTQNELVTILGGVQANNLIMEDIVQGGLIGFSFFMFSRDRFYCSIGKLALATLLFTHTYKFMNSIEQSSENIIAT